MRTQKRFVVQAALLMLLTGIHFSARAQLVINEVSQGPTGTQEYVELVVTGTPTCAGIAMVDLRGWYLDDNNGHHATGSGTGIAPGCIRFTSDPLWSAVPAGTLIVVYNDGDVNPSVPAQDLSLNDGNCVLIIPSSNCTLLEQHGTQPSTANAAYPTSGFSSCGLWTTTSMANGDDSYHTVDPSGTVVHSVSWGNNTLNTVIYFSGSSSGMVASNINAVDMNPALQGNWTRTAVAGNETPGVPNNAANAAWIATMNNSCLPVTPLTATGSSTGTCACTGTATVNASGGIAPYAYNWLPSGGNNATAINLCPGSYTCTVTDFAGCTQQVIVTVNTTTGAPVAQIAASGPLNFCQGDSVVLTASGASQFLWSTGDTTASIVVTAAGNYSVIVTNACGSDTATAVTTVAALPVITLSGNTVICPGESTTLSAGGGNNYLWSTGATTSSISVASAGTYTVISSNACGSDTATISVQQSVINAACTASPLSGSVPLTVTFTDQSTNANAWNWNMGSAGTSSAQNPSATFTTPGVYTVILTVTNADGCTDTASVLIVVDDAGSLVEVPNVFTPNADGTNDVFLIHAEGIAQFHLEIFDRWGVLMSSTDSPTTGWDGRTTSGNEASSGTYYYVLNAVAYNGTVYERTGFFTLAR